ncbi:MAG: FAD-binding oxidoreductase [Ignavibacteriae bacterium]|nr:FAD-binding oxidoreductase [Ignavibacteriota bacterium]
MIIKTQKDTYEQYLTDASNMNGRADALYIPESSDEVSDIIKKLNSEKIPMTISGAGTGLTGGRVPECGVIISTERLNKILSIDKENKLITVQPGLLLSEMENELSNHGLYYRVNPTEKNASIGGNVATNASGSRTFKYGPTRDYVEKLKIILPDGEEIELKRGENFALENRLELKSVTGKKYSVELPEIIMPNVKHAAGYYIMPEMDVIDLFIGSEGTLGFVTEITLKVDSMPENVLGGIAFFSDLDKLFGFVKSVREASRKYDYSQIRNYFNHSLNTQEILINNSSSKLENLIDARTIEYFDNNSLRLLKEDYHQIPAGAEGAIWFEQEYMSENENEVMEEWFNKISEFSILGEYTWTAMNSKEHNLLKEFRHALPQKVFEIIVNNNTLKIGTDTAVPDNYSKQYYKYLTEKLKYYKLDHYIWGHIGNSHFHANIIVKSDIELKNGYAFYDECIDEAIRLGGTVSAEHGIGKLKRKYFYRLFGNEVIEKMKAIKKVFDPNNIMNNGNLFE